MTRLRRLASLGTLLLAAGASLATSEDYPPPIQTGPVDAPAFDLDEGHGGRAFVITMTPNEAALADGIQSGSVNLDLTLVGVGPDGPAASLRLSFEQAQVPDELPTSLDDVGVAPGETQELSMLFEIFRICDEEAGCIQELSVGFEHLGGAAVEVSWVVSVQTHTFGPDDFSKAAAVDVAIRESQAIPD